jgi:putative PIN family toxin of toxin-antitoxin system
MKIVPDTNVLISGIVYPNSIPGKIVGAWRQKSLSFVLSYYILDEFVRVLPRMKQNRLSADEVRELSELFVFFSEIAEPEQNESIDIRDAADRCVLGTLIASDAEYLVTGDKDLTALADRFPIVTPREFWGRHG